jgi:putative ABC transport system permease protein
MRPEHWLFTIPLRLRSLFRCAQVDQELDDELRDHLERATERYVAQGMAQAEARGRARLDLGGVEQTKEKCRDARRVNWIQDFVQDSQFGLRILRKSPGFTVVAVLTLALAIGANTALFSVVKGVLLNTLPYRDPDRLFTLAEGDADRSDPTNVSYGEVEDWEARSAPFPQIALSKGWTPAISSGGHSEITYGLRVTQNFFDLLGVSPAKGRFFLPEEDRPGRWHVVVLSYPFWMRRFAGNPDVVGKTVLLSQIPFQIVGVLPQDFQPLSFTDAGSPPDIWAPLGYDLSIPESGRSWQHLHAVARLQDGVSIWQARAQMNSITAQLIHEFPKDYAEGAHVLIQPLRETWYGKVRTALWLLLAATGFVLLIACANVANLLLARGTQKNREVALRSALGATRSRIVRQLLTESTLLAVLGGAVGLLLAVGGTALLTKWAPQQIPRLKEVCVDPGVLVFALLISTTTGVLMGLVPALQASRADHRGAMQQSGRGVLGTRSRVRSMLVISEVCLAFVLSVASGLLLKSFMRAWDVDPGFTPQNLYEVNFTLVGAKYDDDKAVVRAQTEALERLRRIPGVESVSLASTPPGVGGFGGFDQAGFVIQDRRVPDPEVPSVDRYIVSPDYFRTTKIPLLHGRWFTEVDSVGANQVAIISATTAHKMFPGEDPLGRRIQLGARRDAQPWAEIIGIVGDVHHYGPDAPVTPQAYVLYTHSPFNYATVILVRSAVAPVALTPAIEEQIWAIDKNTMVFNPFLMSQIVSDSLASRRFTMSLLSGFGVLALILAAIGIYGVLSCTVTQRTNEIGIRMALGASSSDVGCMVLQEALLMAAVAVVVGWAGALLFARVLRSLLFEVSPNDPGTLLAVSCTLLAVAAVSAFVPVWRAMCVDPMVALRYE